MGDRNEIVAGHLDGLPIYENKPPIKRSLHNMGHKRWKEIPNLGSILLCACSYVPCITIYIALYDQKFIPKHRRDRLMFGKCHIYYMI